MNRLILCFIFLPVLFQLLRAQGTNPAATEQGLRIQSWVNSQIVVPPSPQAASLGQFGEVGVSKYTGALEFALPIHTMQGRRISMPIVLQYSGGANKVSDLPSWVGLGWTLQTGGVITRSTQGDPDFEYNYHKHWKTIETLTASRDRFEQYNIMEKVIRSEIETRPDIYYYNLPGESGKFYIVPVEEGRSYKLQIISKDGSHLRFERRDSPNGDTESFVITDTKGTRYHFTATERTYYHTDDDGDGRSRRAPKRFTYNSSWHLTRIENALSREYVHLTYHTEDEPYIPPSVGVGYDTYTYATSTSKVNGTYPCGNPYTANKSSGASYSLLHIDNRRFLRSATLVRGSQEIEHVEFSSLGYTRKWGSYTYENRRLTGIYVSKVGNRSSKIKHHLTYYCHAEDRRCSDKDAGRLTLKSYRGPSSVSTSRDEYVFSYNSTKLPDPLSLAIDHWGYYNKNSRSSLAPRVDIGGRVLKAGEADRETDEHRVKAGVLEKIRYPTGGYTRITWEPHRVKKEWDRNNQNKEVFGAGIRVKQLDHYADDDDPATTVRYKYTTANGKYSSALLMTVPDYTRSEHVETSWRPSFGGIGDDGGGTRPGPIPITGGPPQKSANAGSSDDKNCSYVSVSSTSLAPLGAVKGSFVGYYRVEEINAGSTVYHFTNQRSTRSTYDDYENGELVLVEHKDSKGRVVASVATTYDYVATEHVNVDQATTYVEPVSQQSDKYLARVRISSSSHPYRYSWVAPWERDRYDTDDRRMIKSRLAAKRKSVQTRRRAKVAETTTQYFYASDGKAAGSMARTFTYEYRDVKTTQPTAVSFTDSDGTVRRTEFAYAGGAQLSQFTRAHAYDVISQTTHKASGKTLYQQKLGYHSGKLQTFEVHEVWYRYNGIERNDELGLDLAPFRSYDPSIGRWLQVDPMAEYAPEMTPYRFGFNNPILWSDPLGLFETKEEAEKYAEENDIKLGFFARIFKGNKISENSDGTFEILQGFGKGQTSTEDQQFLVWGVSG